MLATSEAVDPLSLPASFCSKAAASEQALGSEIKKFWRIVNWFQRRKGMVFCNKPESSVLPFFIHPDPWLRQTTVVHISAR